MSNCYVFKSRLQEYAQKALLSTPVYETIKEGPSHEPSFRSTVVVNEVRYDSLPGFSSRKSAEQSAAEVALVELEKSGVMNESISQPVHETGLCKNLLQEYAQKMNYAIPLYECHKVEQPGRALFSCHVDIGGIKYIGASAKTKKEAEIKAARVALLAIQSTESWSSEQPNDHSMYTVIPSKKVRDPLETPAMLKPKKGKNLKKKPWKNRRARNGGNRVHDENMGNLGVDMDGRAGLELNQIDASGVQVTNSGVPLMEGTPNWTRDERSEFNGNKEGLSAANDTSAPFANEALNQSDASGFRVTNLGFLPISAVNDALTPFGDGALDQNAASGFQVTNSGLLPMEGTPNWSQDGKSEFNRNKEGLSAVNDASTPFGNGAVNQSDASGFQVANSGLQPMEGTLNWSRDERTEFTGKKNRLSALNDASAPFGNGDLQDGHFTGLSFHQPDLGSLDVSMICGGDITGLVKEVNEIPGVEQVASVVNNSTMWDGLNQMANGTEATQSNGSTIGV
ncbi:hypothetical protein RJ640_023524 [Escallonia rubra]|uniref:DRBM domain-containing protein n=1 Tax=Escallonia rubra TaxID=112253 RepID=A0AA88UDG3_9ASTE|nr:hypothetical protein RJ640_023524 [Escallonia rubra]